MPGITNTLAIFTAAATGGDDRHGACRRATDSMR
jgi:hypothetical protein